jgi:hypothetical protein
MKHTMSAAYIGNIQRHTTPSPMAHPYLLRVSLLWRLQVKPISCAMSMPFFRARVSAAVEDREDLISDYSGNGKAGMLRSLWGLWVEPPTAQRPQLS